MTLQQYYGGLNRRFDKRSRFLYRLGFRYHTAEVSPPVPCRRPANTAVFVRWNMGTTHDSIPAAVLHHASNIAWNVLLGGILRRA